jgi:2-keto-4-pentenoate hydratase/2-oxohepta-3-ene-1,7-dioic acid hydratase in catechol pathway
MRFCVFETASGPHLGCASSTDSGLIVDLTADWHEGNSEFRPPADVAELAALGSEGLGTVRLLLDACKTSLEIAGLHFLAPIPRPRKNVFCVGRNYREHIIEGNIAQGRDRDLMPEHIQFFSKAPTTVIGPGAPIPLHSRHTTLLDYEAELAIVLSGGGSDMSEQEAERAVFGYTIINDVTARDLQRRHDQWFKGKSLDGTCPMGPWVVHKSSVPDPHALSIRLWVNGEMRQNANTSSMIFKVPHIVSKLSEGLTLEPGDIIATGTPSGVGYAMTPPQRLRNGDEVSIEIGGIGRLENVVRDDDDLSAREPRH